MTDSKPYVSVDEHGVMRVGQSRVMLDSIMAGFDAGHSPETIRQQYPALSLEEVYGAITFYLADPAPVREYLQRQSEEWHKWQQTAETATNPVIERLRAIKHGQSAVAP